MLREKGVVIMHMLIAAIVEADGKEEAMTKAASVFEDLVDEGIFDYYNLFVDEGAKKRWGMLSPAVRLESDEGKQLLDRLLKATKENLFENLKAIRELLQEYSDEDIWFGDDFDSLPTEKKVYRLLKQGDKKVDFEKSVRFLRYCCRAVGSYVGNSIYLYDETGDGIRSLTELNYILKKGEVPLKEVLEMEKKMKVFVDRQAPSKLWIVPADVHY
jgi:hypothetical protein